MGGKHISGLTAPLCDQHKPKQHRDNKPPWCNTCGLTAEGKTPNFGGNHKEQSKETN